MIGVLDQNIFLDESHRVLRYLTISNVLYVDEVKPVIKKLKPCIFGLAKR